MELDKKFRIEQVPLNWVLVERTTPAKDKQGKQRMTDDGVKIYNEERSYYANLKYCCLAYLSKAQTGAKDVQDAVNRMVKAEQNVLKALEK